MTDLITSAPAHPAEALESALPADRAADNWPPTLDDDTALALLSAIEGGETKTLAPEKVGLTYRTVQRWCKRFPVFAAWIESAQMVGYQQRVDRIPTYAAAAFDRDTAAAAKVKIEAEEKWLKLSAPYRYGPKLGLDMAGGGEGEVAGYVLVPLKLGQPQPNGPVIEGSAIRVPMKQPAAAADA